MITETSTTSIPRPVTEMLKKSVLKSTSGGSVDIPTTDKMLDVKTTEVRSPSPIPEDPVGEEDKRSIATLDREKKPEEKNKDEGKKKDGKEKDKAEGDKTSEILEKSREQTESKMVQDEDKRPKPESSREATAKGTDSDERKASAVSQKEKVSKSPVIQATTSERGKSKATGKITGGWI